MSSNRILSPSTHPAGPASRAPLVGGNQTIVLSDYRHAARIFTDDNFRLSPKYGFLFYVEFDFNPLITNISNLAAQELGMIVKSVGLPKYTVDTKVHNAYNRVNIVQNKIKYDPVNIVFHDDQADNVRNFWYDYYSYFFRDPDYADATYNAPHKYQSRPSFDWGYSPRPAVGYNTSLANQPYQYIQAIRIYSLYQKSFSEYELINPTITSFKHGDHVNGENNLLTHEMSVQFETVKYHTGFVTDNNVGGFIDLHYDRVTSPLLADPDMAKIITTGEGGIAFAPDTIDDLANFSTSVNPYLRSDQALAQTSMIGAGSYGLDFRSTTLLAAGTVTTNGGFSIPSFGSLAQGATNSASIGQQLQAAGVGLANRSTTTLVNGVIGGVAKGLGSNGRSIVGLAAQAIANPSAALATVKNMATQYAMAYVNKTVNSAVTAVSNKVSDAVAGFVKDKIATPASEAFNSFAASSFSADFNFSLGIGQYSVGSEAWQAAQEW